MAVTEAKRKANRKWDEAHRGNYWRCTIVFPAEEKQKIIDKANAANLSISDYVRGLIEKDVSE